MIRDTNQFTITRFVGQVRVSVYRKYINYISSPESYLKKASEDRDSSAIVHRKCTDLQEIFTDHRFILYLLLLKDTLPLLTNANKSCREPGMSIHESYRQILTLVKTLAEPIVSNNGIPNILNAENKLPVSN